MKLNRLAAVLPFLSVVACASGADEATSASEAHDTSEAPAVAPVKGREYARCWFDAAGDGLQLSCTSTARGADPLAVEVTVTLVGGIGSAVTTVNRNLDTNNGGAVVVGSVPKSALPARVVLGSTYTRESNEVLGILGDATADVLAHKTVMSIDDLPAAKPLVIGQPYDLWPVGIRNAADAPLVVDVAYARSLAPYSTATAKVDAQLFVQPGQNLVTWLIAPESGALTAKIGASTAPLAGPGYYVTTGTELRAATVDEARMFGAAPHTQ